MYLRYFGIRVTNLESSIKFYTELPRLREVGRGSMAEYGGGRGEWVLLRDPISGQQLELNMYPKGSKYSAAYVPGEGLDHIGFMVRDVQAKYMELLAKGLVQTETTPENT